MPKISPVEKWVALVETPPDRDLNNIAIQYGLSPSKKTSLNGSDNQNHRVGKRDIFTVINLQVPELYEVEAELVYVTNNVYWYVDVNHDFDKNLYEIA